MADPVSASTRALRSKERLLAAGGRTAHIRIAPAAVGALSALQSASGLGVAETIGRALLVADAARRLYPADRAVSLEGCNADD